MKKGYILTFVFILFINSFSIGATFNSVQSGKWDATTTWGGAFPDYTKLNNDVINIGKIGIEPSDKHTITLGTAVARVKVGEGNGVHITIRSGSKLEIFGDIDVKNNFKIDVENGAIFILHGSVNLGGGGGTGSQGQLIINGTANISGSIAGSGTVSGGGDLYVGGTIGITTGGFTGTVVNGNTDLSLPFPTSLTGFVTSTGEIITVNLSWAFTGPAKSGVIVFQNFEVYRVANAGVNMIATPTGTSFSESLPYAEYSSQVVQYYARAKYTVDGAVKYSQISNIENFNGSALPIDLLYFNAKAEGTVVEMNWATATEINNDFFTIERSANGRNWDVIGYLQGAGNANHTISYNFTDMNPLTGISYYRLKQTDFDGRFEYFAPVAINFNAAINAGEILSAAAQGQRLNLWVNNPDAAATVVVANLQGRVLYQGNVTAADYAQQIQIDIAQNIAGEILIIRLSSSQSSDERKIMAR